MRWGCLAGPGPYHDFTNSPQLVHPPPLYIFLLKKMFVTWCFYWKKSKLVSFHYLKKLVIRRRTPWNLITRLRGTVLIFKIFFPGYSQSVSTRGKSRDCIFLSKLFENFNNYLKIYDLTINTTFSIAFFKIKICSKLSKLSRSLDGSMYKINQFMFYNNYYIYIVDSLKTECI